MGLSFELCQLSQVTNSWWIIKHGLLFSIGVRCGSFWRLLQSDIVYNVERHIVDHIYSMHAYTSNAQTLTHAHNKCSGIVQSNFEQHIAQNFCLDKLRFVSHSWHIRTRIIAADTDKNMMFQRKQSSNWNVYISLSMSFHPLSHACSLLSARLRLSFLHVRAYLPQQQSVRQKEVYNEAAVY